MKLAAKMLLTIVTSSLTISCSTSTAPQSPPPSTTRFAYATAGGAIFMYTVNPETGQLRPNWSLDTGNNLSFIAVHPSSKLLYALDSLSKEILTFRPDPTTGILTSTGIPTPTGGGGPRSIAIHPSGKFLYVPNSDSSNISGFVINIVTGLLTPVPGSPFPFGQSSSVPRFTAIDPNGRFLYVADTNGSAVFGYAIDQSTGILSPVPGSPFPSGPRGESVTIDPHGRILYVASIFPLLVSAFTIDQTDGRLIGLPGSPFTLAGGIAIFSMTMDRSGRFLFAQLSNELGVYQIDTATGGVVGQPVSTVPTGFGVRGVSVDPFNKFVYLTDNERNSFSAYRLDPLAGILTLSGTVGTGISPTSISFLQSSTPATYAPTVAYSANATANSISAYTVDPVSGTLAGIIGSPFSAGTNPQNIAIEPFQRFAYVSNLSASGTITGFRIVDASGSLSPIAGSPFPSGSFVRSVATDPSGRFVYATEGENLRAFSLASTGVLAPLSGSPYPTLGEAGQVAIVPSGLFIYVVNRTATGFPDGAITIFRAFRDGTLSQLSFQTGFKSPSSLAIHPTGLFAYITNEQTSNVTAVTLNPEFGQLVNPIAGSPFPAGQQPVSAAVDPDGRFLYVANAGSNTVSAYGINPGTGAITTAPGSPFLTGTTPRSVTVDPSGSFLYVANSTDGTISAFAINPNNGALTALNGSPFVGTTSNQAIVVIGKIQ